MEINLNYGENLTIKLGDRGAVVIQWMTAFRDGNLINTEDCSITVFRADSALMRCHEIKNSINPQGSIEIKLEEV